MKNKAARKDKGGDAHKCMSTIIPHEDTNAPTAVAIEGAAKVCATHRTQHSVRFDPSTHSRTRLADDDFLHAFQATDVRGRGGFRAALKAQHTLHIDYAHTISLGYHNQRYYLVMVIDGIDFLWASASKKKQGPEELLEEFLRYTQVTISKLRMDDAGEFTTSESFKLWCANRDIVICPTAGYNHKMQALTFCNRLYNHTM